MIFLSWTLVVIITLLLALLLYFLFFILLPSIKNDSTEKLDPVFSEIEMNYVIPKEEVVPESEKRAFVRCSYDKTFLCSPNNTKLNKGTSCLVANSVFKSDNDCIYSCLGLGDCVQSCPQHAIILKNNTAFVTNLCIGCGLCIKACPKGIITLIDKKTKKNTVCMVSEDQDSLTTCSHLKKESNVERTPKKGFKIWVECYKILKHKQKK